MRNLFFVWLTVWLVVVAGTASATVTRAGSVWEQIVADGRLKSFSAELRAANLHTMLQQNGPFTVLAPTDDAFRAASGWAGLNATTKRQTLLYHIVPGSYDSAALMKQGRVNTALGQPLTLAEQNGLLVQGKGRLVSADIPAHNGILHVQDTVLTPPGWGSAPAPAPAPAPGPAPTPGTPTMAQRFGVYGSPRFAKPVHEAGLPFGSLIASGYLNPNAVPEGVQVWQVVRLNEAKGPVDFAAVEARVRQMPRGSLWKIGNEPDVIWQDNVTPWRYAELYHQLYTRIKAIDPTAQVAVGAVATPTPLRINYLNLMLNHYEKRFGQRLPADLWTVHAYILREERDSWGAEIPPGMTWINQGTLYELEDHGDVQEMQKLMREFRIWLRNRGYDTPLAVTEFGILMPEDFGFPPEVVGEYMRQIVRFFMSVDRYSGYSKDGHRIVQSWYWFSLYDSDKIFSVGDLYDPVSGQLTYIGRVYAELLRNATGQNR
jgi:uncharacterized surface protein with fasciclin (FAS1) repeats